MRYLDGKYVPIIECDVCKLAKDAPNLNAEHDDDGGNLEILCKACSFLKSERKAKEKDYKNFGWMPMDAYITALLTNAKVNQEGGNKYLDLDL